MKNQNILLVGLLILIGAGILVMAHTEPSTELLDKDLAQVRAAIQETNNEAAKYNGGLILIQIQLRKSVLQSTEAMLSQKRESFIRRINLKYIVEGKEVAPASADMLDEIQKDIQETENKIEATEKEASQYSGGLIQVTLLMNAETQKMTLAALQQKYYISKYGIPLARVDFDASKDQKMLPGKITKDKDAL